MVRNDKGQKCNKGTCSIVVFLIHMCRPVKLYFGNKMKLLSAGVMGKNLNLKGSST